MNLSVNIAGVEWKNPVTTASGTFGSGMCRNDKGRCQCTVAG